MAACAVNLLLDKLGKYFDKGVQSLGQVGERVVYVRAVLESMKAFLKDADALEENNEEIKVWVKQVRDIAHDTEDALDQYSLLQIHDHEHGIYGSLYKLSCCIKNMKARFRVVAALDDVYSRTRIISETHKRLYHKFCKADQGSGNSSVADMWQSCRADALLLDKNDLVGIDEPKSELISRLVKGSAVREVIPVVGMGGLGKTTLMKQVYDDPVVRKHFRIHVWITVSQSFNIGELVKDIVRQLFLVTRRPIPEGLDDMHENKLKEIINKLLKKRRYLIMLDDVWHFYEWNAVKYALPNNSSGSRIMLTTRNADVASTTATEPDGKVYTLRHLTWEESWELFHRKTFRGRPCPPHLEELCKDIIRKCEGLPLAIAAICGVLATKDRRRIDEWDMVANSLGSEIDGNDLLKDLKKVLLLSFNDLPYHLKCCFLYLSIFPEDYQVKRMRLIRLWIAEGFIEAKDGKTLEDVAEEYLNQLLSRNLIQIAKKTHDGRIKSLRIHDIIREIITSKSKEQNFATIAKDQNTLWPDKVRRLAIHDTLEFVPSNRSVSQLRSLFMFRISDNPSIHKLFPGGTMLLRVLDLRYTNIKRFPVEIINLYHLKYLSLSNTKVEIIPSFIGKFQKLETLELKHCFVTELPDEILKLQELRHLLVYRYKFVSYSNIKYGFKIQGEIGVLRSLQKLSFIDVENSRTILELGKLNQLRRMGIRNLRKEHGEVLCSSINKLSNLHAFSVTATTDDEFLDLQTLSIPPLLLQRLYLRGRLEALPHWIPSLQSLAKLYLKCCRLKDNLLVHLQYLPSLVHLELHQAYIGDTLCFEAGGFKKLTVLGLDNFDELMHIKMEVGTLPYLEQLSIRRCKLLHQVPSGIEQLTKLKVLEFFDMPIDLIMTLRPDKEGNDYKKVAHIPEVYSTYWKEWGWEVYPLESLNEGENTPCVNNTLKSQELKTRLK